MPYNIQVQIDENTCEEITQDQIEQAILMEMVPNRDEGGEEIDPDFEMIEAMLKTLSYFSSPRDYGQFLSANRISEQLSSLRDRFGFSLS